MNTLRPFFTFFGGKWRAAPRYPTPRFNIIIEPFAGSAGYSLRYWKHDVVLVERDEKIAETWRYLISVSSHDILQLPDLLPGQTVNDLDCPIGAKYLIGWWLNKGASSPCITPSAWMRSGIRPNSYWGKSVRSCIATQVNHIRHWTLIEGDYTNAPNHHATWFIDPPYADAGRNYRYKFTEYNMLGDWCRNKNGQIIVCESSGANWLPFMPLGTFKSNPSKYGGKVSHEVIWENNT